MHPVIHRSQRTPRRWPGLWCCDTALDRQPFPLSLCGGLIAILSHWHGDPPGGWLLGSARSSLQWCVRARFALPRSRSVVSRFQWFPVFFIPCVSRPGDIVPSLLCLRSSLFLLSFPSLRYFIYFLSLSLSFFLLLILPSLPCFPPFSLTSLFSVCSVYLWPF